jgi:Restriction endonuclease
MYKIGEPFELLVAQIQARIDPTSNVAHNEYMIDRLGQRLQFDVVIRGQFAGQHMLGVIECKDLRRKVGTPEIDAFHTKAQDINANFKIIASKRGFSDPAIHKAQHYGIRLVSLLDPEVFNQLFAFGDWWTAKVYRWNRLAIEVHSAENPSSTINIAPEKLFVANGRVIDWFTNYLLKEEKYVQGVGWVVGFQLEFSTPIIISTGGNNSHLCKVLTFRAERTCTEHEKFIPLSAEAFIDWHSRTTTIPANTRVSMEAVPADFREWPLRDYSKTRKSCFIPISFEAYEHQFDLIDNAPDLESM